MDLLSKKYAQAKEIAELKQDIEAYKQSEQEASEIIAELKHTLDCKNGTIETLKAENDRLKRIKDELHSIIRRKKEQLKTVNYMLFEEKDMTKNEWKLKYKLAQKDRRYQSYQYMAKKYKTCLQEIKAIAEENQFYFRPGTIVSYETIKQLATSFEQILKLITKEEE